MPGERDARDLDEVDRDEYLRRIRPLDWRNPNPKPLYDLVILGGGPAGLEAARSARLIGLSVALVERNYLGGTSLNVGSMPSKTIIRSATALEASKSSQAFGVCSSGTPTADLAVVMERMRRVRTRLAEYHSAERLREQGIDFFLGDAHFGGPTHVVVDSLRLTFNKAVIATGARPRRSSIQGLEAIGYLTSATIFDIERLPKRLAIIGGGPLGCELAQAFSRLGSRVTILQSDPKFLPNEERDAAELLSRSLSRSGVDTRLNTPVVDARVESGNKVIDATNNGATISVVVDEVLLSIGRVPNTERLNLQSAGIDVDALNRVAIDDSFRTSNEDVFAAGDVCLAHKFTNAAECSARMAVLNAFAGGTNRRSLMNPPWCTYCDPEIAHIGLQVREARRHAVPLKSYTIMMQDVDRAITEGRAEGFVKIHVKDGTDEIVGATIVGSRASKLINEISVVMSARIGMRRLADIMHAYPTQSDAIRLAAVACRDALG